MDDLPEDLLSGVFDDHVSDEQFATLQDWLLSSPENALRYAHAALLHDRLRDEMVAATEVSRLVPESIPSGRPNRLTMRPFMLSGAIFIAAGLGVALWFGFSQTPFSAATELNRLISLQRSGSDRTYRIDVEEIAEPRRGARKREPDDGHRPPKPPLDRAVLHVRHGYQFVLIRQTPEGQPFVTGSDGRTSWAVRPDGPVRVSTDLTRFQRDVPGHEHNMPLMNVEEGLSQLKSAYDVELLPVEFSEEPVSDEDSRLLVGVKKPGFRGPRRVEIAYVVKTGQIRQMRFVDMPYGPQRLTLRMTLLEERDLGEHFFDHTAHHGSDRLVEKE